MIKICFCTTIPVTIEAFMLETAEYLYRRAGWDISFICSYKESFARQLPAYFHYYPVNMRRGVNFDGAKVIREMTRIFRRERFDMVQFSTPNASLYASIAAKRAKIPVRNYHLMGFRYMGASGAERTILKRIEKTACRNATSIECVSHSNMLQGIEAGLFPPEKVSVVWNGSTGGVNLSRFDDSQRTQWRREIRSMLQWGEDDYVYGFAGRLTAEKGVNELLEAFLGLNNDAKLLLVGSMDNRKSLNKQLVEQAKASSCIRYVPSVKDIWRYLAAMDVLVLPSYREGFGNVVIEAGAVGTPAIVSDIPGPRDAVIKDKTALTVPPKNAEALRNAMRQVREPAYSGMGEAAAQFVKSSFDSRKLCEKIYERKCVLLSEQLKEENNG